MYSTSALDDEESDDEESDDEDGGRGGFSDVATTCKSPAATGTIALLPLPPPDDITSPISCSLQKLKAQQNWGVSGSV